MSSDEAEHRKPAGALPEHLHSSTDSAGNPWEGRTFQAHDTAYADDDGSADPRLLAALEGHRAGTTDAVAVLDALRDARLLIPLIAHAGEEGLNEHGVRVDKTQELAIVTVEGPDGRAVLPAFTSVEALARWNPGARPVPAHSRRIALAAASERTELLVLDPGSETEFGVRRPALWALAQDLPWVPAAVDEEVARAVSVSVAQEPAVVRVELVGGPADLRGPEVTVLLALLPGLDRDQLNGLLGRLQASWAADEVIAERVDSLGIRIASV